MTASLSRRRFLSGAGLTALGLTVLAPAFGHAGLNLWDPEARFQRRFG